MSGTLCSGCDQPKEEKQPADLPRRKSLRRTVMVRAQSLRTRVIRRIGIPTSRARLEALEERRLFSTLTVTSLQDSGAGSLRAQIATAQSGDTIVFSSTLFS